MIDSILGVVVTKPKSNDLPTTLESALSLKDYRRQLEASYIKHVMALADGSITKAAQTLGIDRSHLHQKIKDLDI